MLVKIISFVTSKQFHFQVKTIANLKQASSSSVNRFQDLNQDSCLLVPTWPPQSSEAVLIVKRPVRSKKPNRLTRSIKPTHRKNVLDPVPTRCENLFGKYAPKMHIRPYLAYLSAYMSAPNVVKWGVPEKILQNAVQTR